MRRPLILFVLAAAALAATHLLFSLRPTVPGDPVVMGALENHHRLTESFHAARESSVDEQVRGELRRTDPLGTGLVGIEWSSYTTTSGDLSAKRLSASELWVSVFIDWYRRAGLEAGDRVGIVASGSFPALAWSARLAAESLDLVPVTVISLTSSTYGANIPEFDFWDMESHAHSQGLIRHGVTAVSLGGDGDRGDNLELVDRAILQARLEQIANDHPGVTILRPRDTPHGIDLRTAIFFPDDVASQCRLVVNIGGHAANFGTGLGALALPRGYIPANTAIEASWAGDSVILRSLRRGIPVVNLLDVRGIAGTERLRERRGVEGATAPVTHTSAVRLGAFVAGSVLLLSLALLVRSDAGSVKLPRGKWWL
jgi:poly-gamma-glutamate system protein